MEVLENCLSKADYEVCPGKYCARIILNESICLLSECQRCPRGTRPITKYDLDICGLCTNEASLYEFMYLIFMMNVAILMHLISIDKFFAETKRRNWPEFDPKKIAIIYIQPIVENLLALTLSILVFSPVGTLKLHSCLVNNLFDWYSIFFDPYIDYSKKLNCSQEIVYPLYSIVVVYFLFSSIIMLAMRPIISKVILKEEIYKNIQSKSIFAELHYLPILIIVHLVAGGLIYYCFPIITIVGVILSNNWYLSKMYEFRIREKNYIKDTISNSWKLLKSPRNLTTMFILWYLLIFGIVALTRFENGLFDLFYLILTPGPLLFFVISFKYTNPKNTI